MKKLPRLKKIIQNFTNKRVLVIGDIILDQYLYCSASRLSPEAPIPIVKVEKEINILGGAANTAANIQSLRGQVFLLGVIGNDINGEKLKSILLKKNINIEGIYCDNKRVTTTKSRIIAHSQHVVRIDKENIDEINIATENFFLDLIQKYLSRTDIVLISDYAKGVLKPTFCQKIIKLALRKNIKVIIDPKGNNYRKYRHCFALTPNLKELQEAVKEEIKQPKQLKICMKKLLKKVGSVTVLATLGENGMALLSDTGKYYTIPAPSIEVVDIAGAGDTAIAAFTLALVSRASYREAIFLATCACKVVISKTGTATVSFQELLEAIKNIKLKKRGF